MRGTLPRLATIVVILAITLPVVSKLLLGGPDPQAGKCVDRVGALVGCGERTALYKLVREVDDGPECHPRARSSTSSAAASTAASR